jgi:hypothetical protein
MAINPMLRQQIHDSVDTLLTLMEQAAKESSNSPGALLPKAAAERLGYKSANSVHELVRAGKLQKVNGLIPMQSINDFLGVTPRARRRAAK